MWIYNPQAGATIGNSMCTVTIGSPQLASGTPGAAAGEMNLTDAELAPIVTAAETNWEAVGVKPARFGGVQFHIGTLGSNYLSATSGKTISISANAACRGDRSRSCSAGRREASSDDNCAA